MKTKFRFFSLLGVLALANFAHAQKIAKNKDLPNFYQVNANLYRGGQPTEEGIKKLARMGVKTIIDLRGESDLSRREAVWAQNAGLKFVPVSLNNWLKPKTSQVNDILKEIDKIDGQPVFVHCKRGADRTGTIIAVYRITRDGWTARAANEEAEKFGFGWWQVWMKDYVKDYYRDFKKQN